MANDNSHTLDPLDFDILSHLQQDGRKPLSEIAKALDVSVGTVRNRMNRMLEEGTLWIYARINPQRAGFKAPANIRIIIEPSHLIDEAAMVISAFPEVSYVAMLAGEFDLEVDVMCRDTEHLTWFIQNRLHHVEGVSRTMTNIILKAYTYGQPDLRLIHQGNLNEGVE